jgi:hypothetical protein
MNCLFAGRHIWLINFNFANLDLLDNVLRVSSEIECGVNSVKIGQVGLRYSARKVFNLFYIRKGWKEFA